MNTTAIILELLTDAAKAHGIHEEQELGGVYDEQWPEWYTDHMVAALEARGLRIVAADETAASEA